MARKKKHEEHENHERWLVSYADFITLLFAFFVVMYSISSVNEGKYRVLSESLSAAFRSSARSLEPIQVGELVRSPRPTQPALIEIPKLMPLRPAIIDMDRYPQVEDFQGLSEDPGWGYDGNGRGGDGAGDDGLVGSTGFVENGGLIEGAGRQIDDIASDVEASLGELIQEGLVTVRRNKLWLEVEINTSILFSSASAQPSLDAEFVLRRLATLLNGYPNRVHVEGFTDNEPISTGAFPSNWELSSARAAAVVRLFADYGVEPWRMASVGYGEHRPVSDNSTALGRARNRRVVIVIVADLQQRGEEPTFTDIELMRSQAEAELQP